MRKKRDIAESLFSQLQTQKTVVNLDAERHVRQKNSGGIEIDEAAGLLLIRFQVGAELDLSFLLDIPNLARPFAEGFQAWGLDKRSTTRLANKSALKVGFAAFLASIERPNISIDDIDGPLLVTFVKWLNRPDAQNGKPWSLGTRSCCVKAFRAVVNGFKSTQHWHAHARRLAGEIPENPWPGRARKGTPTERLERDHLEEILRAAELEIRRTVTMLDEGTKMLQDGRRRLPHIAGRRSDYHDPSVCLATLDALFPGIVPDIPDVIAVNGGLRAVIEVGHNAMTKYLYPTARMLVPFVLFLATSSAMNAESLLFLEWSMIETDEVFGYRFVRVRPEKARATGSQARVLPAAPVNGIGVEMVLEIVRTWTKRILPLADARYRDRIFLFVNTTGSKHPKSYGTRLDHKCDGTWLTHLKGFCRDNKLRPFSLQQIRTTILDEVQQTVGDVIVAKRLGGHRDPTTTWTHYTSDGTRKRYKERLGEAFLLRSRWRETKGRCDPRAHTASQDVGAATPGFLCFDPFDSPQPNQTAGRLCTAYGRCPECPLAAANIADISCVANYQALKKAIMDAQMTLTPKAWLTQWAPVLQSLESLLETIPAKTLEKAKLIKVLLPPVG